MKRKKSGWRVKDFAKFYTAEALVALGLLIWIGVIISLLYAKDVTPSMAGVIKAITALTTAITGTPTCSLYSYDVPYVCGVDTSSALFENFVMGQYTTTMFVNNPLLINITYDSYVTTLLPSEAVMKPGDDVVLPAKQSRLVFNCDTVNTSFSGGTFFAGVMSVSSSSPVSAWGVQTLFDSTSNTPILSTTPATQSCIMYTTS